MAGPSRYNRKLKAKNDRKKARASRGGRTPSEAALGRSMAAAGNRVSRSNRRATAPPSTRTFSKERTIRARRLGPLGLPAADRSKTLSEIYAERPEVARQLTGLSPRKQEAVKILDSEGREKSVAERRGDVAETAASIVALPAGGAAGAVGGTVIKQGAKTVFKKAGKGFAKKARKGKGGPKPKPKPTGKKQPKAERKPPKGSSRPKARRRPTVKESARRSPVAGVAGGTYAVGKVNPDLNAAKDAATFVEGTAEAPFRDPVQYTENTAKALASLGAAFVAAPIAAGKSGGRAISKGVNEATGGRVLSDFTGEQIAAPITDPAKELYEGTKEVAKQVGSGDKEKVIDAYNNPEGGMGGIAFIPFGQAVRGVGRTPLYQAPRRKARQAAASRRAKKRQERAAERQAAEGGATPTGASGVRATKSRGRKRADKKDARPVARDSSTSPAEEYIFQGSGRRKEARRGRKDSAERATVEQQTALRWSSYDRADLDEAASRIRVPKGADKNEYRRNAQALALMGLDSAMPTKAGRAFDNWADEMRSILPQPKGELPEGQPIPRRLVEWAKQNPEVLSDPAFRQMRQRAKEIFEAEERIRPDGTWPSRKSLTIRRGQTAQAAGIPEPRELAAAGVRVRQGGKTRTVKTEYKTMDSIRRARAEYRAKLAEARSLNRRARAEADPSRAQPIIEASLAARAEARTIARKLEDTKLANLRAEQIVEQRIRGQVIEPLGLETPVRVPHVERVSAKEGLPPKAARDRSAQRGPSEEVGTKMNEFRLLPENRADFSAESVMGLVAAQRLQRAQNRYTQDMVARHHAPVPTRRGPQLWATSDEIADAIRRGELPSGGIVLLDKQFANAAIRQGDTGKGWTIDELARASDTTAASYGATVARAKEFGVRGRLPDGGSTAVGVEELLRAMRKGEVDGLLVPGHKYAVVPAWAAREIMAQAQNVHGAVLNAVTALNRGTSTAILGYNPSWFGAQQIAEGGPAIIAAGLNPRRWGRIRKAGKEIKAMDNETRAAIEAAYGQAGGIFQIPRSYRGGKPSKIADLNEPAVTRGGQMARLLKMAAKGQAINQAVLKTGGAYRRWAFLAKIDKDHRGLVRGLGGTLLLQERAIKATGSTKLSDIAAWIAKNPAERARYQRYMTDVMGEWIALSAREKQLAPWLAFYPYLRYSLKWGIWSFPKRHPFKATLLWYLAAMNVKELEELVDNGKVADWITYAFPVVWNDGEAQVLPGGTRFTPMMSALVEGLGSANITKAFGALNPGVKLALDTVLGRDSFSGEKIVQEGWGNTHTDGPFKAIPSFLLERFFLAAAGLLAMNAPVRAVDTATDKPIRAIKPRRTFDEGTVIGGRGTESERFAEIESPWIRALRGIAPFGPLVPMGADEFRRQNELKNEMDEKYNPKRRSGSSSSSRSTPKPSPLWWAR